MMLECFCTARTSEEHLIKADSLPLTETHITCHEWAAEDRASGKSLLSLEQHTYTCLGSHTHNLQGTSYHRLTHTS